MKTIISLIMFIISGITGMFIALVLFPLYALGRATGLITPPQRSSWDHSIDADHWTLHPEESNDDTPR